MKNRPGTRLVVHVPPVGEEKAVKERLPNGKRKWSKLARSMVAAREGRR